MKPIFMQDLEYGVNEKKYIFVEVLTNSIIA